MIMPASRFKRFCAYFIDYLITFLPLILLNSFILSIFKPEFLKYTSMIYSLSIILFYYVFFESSKYRATPGKMLFNLYVTDIYNHKLSLTRAMYRYILWILPTLPLFFLITMGSSSKHEAILANLLWLLLIAFSLMFVWIIPIFFTKERKTVYDMLSSTRVNSRRPRLATEEKQ